MINMHREQLSENPSIEFMKQITKLHSFAMFIEDEDDELIKKKHIVHSYKEMIDVICYNLNWDVSQGILLIKKDSQ